MPPIAQTALAASIVLSALGAVVICLLTAAFGFTPPDDEPPSQATRRRFLTRTGHAVAAVCFAATAILLAVVLAQPLGSPQAAGDPRVSDLVTKLGSQMERLRGVEARMKDSERALERLETDVTDIATGQRVSVDRATASPPVAAAPTPDAAPPARPASPGKPVAKTPPAKPAPGSKAPERPAAAEVPRQAPAPRAAIETPRPAPPAAAPVAPPTPAPAAPKDTEQPSASPPPPPPAAASAPPPAPPPSAAPPAPRREPAPSPPPSDFRTKLRDDWRAIQRGVESASDDFKRAIDRLRSGVAGE